MRPFLASLTLTLLAYVGTPHAAPVPPPRPPPPARAPTGPLTAAELQRFNVLLWGTQEWPITFTADGQYACFDKPEEDGSRSVWYGKYTLSVAFTGRVPESYLEIDEFTGEVRPDAPPRVTSGPWLRVLRVRREGGRIVGEGWGGPLILRRR